MYLRTVSLMLSEAILWVLLMKRAHNLISSHLGDDARRGDMITTTIPFDHRELGELKLRYAKFIDCPYFVVI